jgi:hypothetical protein
MSLPGARTRGANAGAARADAGHACAKERVEDVFEASTQATRRRGSGSRRRRDRRWFAEPAESGMFGGNNRRR